MVGRRYKNSVRAFLLFMKNIKLCEGPQFTLDYVYSVYDELYKLVELSEMDIVSDLICDSIIDAGVERLLFIIDNELDHEANDQTSLSILW